MKNLNLKSLNEKLKLELIRSWKKDWTYQIEEGEGLKSERPWWCHQNRKVVLEVFTFWRNITLARFLHYYFWMEQKLAQRKQKQGPFQFHVDFNMLKCTTYVCDLSSDHHLFWIKVTFILKVTSVKNRCLTGTGVNVYLCFIDVCVINLL